MPPYAGPLPPARTGEVVETLRLMAYLVVALVLIVLDHRGGWLRQVRAQVETAVQPVRMLAGWPGRAVERLVDDAGTLSQLTGENRRLRNALLVNQARMARMQTVAADNTRLRALLDAAQRGRLDVQLAPILDVDLDPTRQRLVLDAGARDGVRVGQTVLDAGGLVGQVIETGPLQSTVLLLTDASHAVPVAVARNGVRLVAYGNGRSDRLHLPTVPTSSDVKVGDVLVTSGLGGRFPAGFPVGTITTLRPDDSRAFLLGDVTPAAQFDRGREVLLLRGGGSRGLGVGSGPSGGVAEGAAGTDATPSGDAAVGAGGMPVTTRRDALAAANGGASSSASDPSGGAASAFSPSRAGERVGERGRLSGRPDATARRADSLPQLARDDQGNSAARRNAAPLPRAPRSGPSAQPTGAPPTASQWLASRPAPPPALSPARGGEGAEATAEAVTQQSPASSAPLPSNNIPPPPTPKGPTP